MLNGEVIQMISIHRLIKIVQQNIYTNDITYKFKHHGFFKF